MYLDELIAAIDPLALIHTLCDRIDAGICVFDEAGRYVLANRAYCAIHGYRAEDLLGQPFTLTLPPGVHELGMLLHHEVLAGTSFPPAEWLVRRKDGTNVAVQATNTGLSQSNGARYRVVIVEDVSARRRLEDERDQLRAQLELATSIDGLTQVASRAALLQLAERELVRGQRYHHTMTVILFDLDQFRQINDQYGLAVGDEVLRLIAALCRRMIRVSDTVGRYGGEEFAVLLPVTEHLGGLKLARRLRKAITAQPWQTTAGPVSVAASFGVGTSALDDPGFDSLLMRASAALFVAKQRGGNRVVSAAALGRKRSA